MILTCPGCATRYFVADDRVGPEGRTVRCASCATKWTARPEAPLVLAPAPILDIFDPNDPPPLLMDSEPAPVLSELPGEELPKAFRERAQTRERMREAATQGVIWASLIGGLAILAGMAVVLRQDVARLWPRTAGAYAMIGLPVNLVGLAIENQHAQPALRDGHAALVVTGQLRNIRDRAIVAPALRISLLNPSGKPVAVKIADPDGASIPPGQARRFSVDLLDPPVSATDVEIAFALDAPHRHGPPAASFAPPPVKASLRGPADLAPSAAPLTEATPPGEGSSPTSTPAPSTPVPATSAP